jgi:hypothetical protein
MGARFAARVEENYPFLSPGHPPCDQDAELSRCQPKGPFVISMQVDALPLARSL